MDNRKEELLQELDRCVLEMEDDSVVKVAEQYIGEGYDAYDGIVKGLSEGMRKAGDLYEEEEYFVPELLLCSEAMYNGMDVLKPHLTKDESSFQGNVVIGVVEGDTHDIGKNLVKTMLETAGFSVYDLGRDVKVEAFVDKVKEVNAKLLCMSTLMTTTMHNMRRVIEALENEHIRDNVKVMVGGGPISKAFADQIGADAYTANAAEAAKAAKRLVQEIA